jgi:quercetin dioxygenase-like cupin family protein
MTSTDKQVTPSAYSREVNVASTIKYMGQVITLLAKGSETNGRLAFMEVKVRPGLEPPVHIHEREHELFFVLEGSVRFYTPDKTFDAHAGGVGFLPQGKAHTFACLTDEVRALILVGATGPETVGMDGYLLQMGEAARDLSVPAPSTIAPIEDPTETIQVGASWGIRFLSPEDTKKALPEYPGFGVRVS